MLPSARSVMTASDRARERRPSASRVELVTRQEQRLASDDVNVHSRRELAVVRVRERGLGGGLLRNGVLRRRQVGLKLGLGRTRVDALFQLARNLVALPLCDAVKPLGVLVAGGLPAVAPAFLVAGIRAACTAFAAADRRIPSELVDVLGDEPVGIGEVDMTVARGVLLQVILVIVLGWSEVLKARSLGDDGGVVLRLRPLDGAPNGRAVGSVSPIDSTAVLRTRP